MAVPNSAITKTVRKARLFTLSSERLIWAWLLAPTHLATFCLAGKCCIREARAPECVMVFSCKADKPIRPLVASDPHSGSDYYNQPASA